MNFKRWHDEIADMPVQDSKGNWIDLETGVAFQSARSPKKQVSRVIKSVKISDADRIAIAHALRAIQSGHVEAALVELIDERMPVLVAICNKLTKRNEVFADKGSVLQAIRQALTA